MGDLYADHDVTHGEILNRVERLEGQMTDLRIQVAQEVGRVGTKLETIDARMDINQERADEALNMLAEQKVETTIALGQIDKKLDVAQETQLSWFRAIRILAAVVGFTGTLVGIAAGIFVLL